MPLKPLKKAVLPVAGLGTRFLPATKAMAKECCQSSTSPSSSTRSRKRVRPGSSSSASSPAAARTAIVEHFDVAYELERTLADRNKTAELDALRAQSMVRAPSSRVRQQVPMGLGHAIWCARAFVGDDPSPSCCRTT